MNGSNDLLLWCNIGKANIILRWALREAKLVVTFALRADLHISEAGMVDAGTLVPPINDLLR
jgi:hypothetical protein